MQAHLLREKLNLNLNEEKLEEILYHSSYQPQEILLQKRNKAYITLGNGIISALFSIYLYKTNDNINESDFSKQLHRRASVQEEVYVFYELEQYVNKSKGEENTSHQDVATKLITLIYLELGIKAAYDFLIPFFEKTLRREIIDYKTLVQEYAQSKKTNAIYKVFDVTGPEHQLIFKCQLSVNQEISFGEACGKRKAEKEAAKSFVEKYNVKPLKKHNKLCTHKVNRYIDDKRMKELELVKDKLNLTEECITTLQLDEAFTHSSYLNTVKDKGYVSNSKISILGAKIIEMISALYVISNYNLSSCDVNKEVSAIVNENNLLNSINIDLTGILLKVGDYNKKAIDRFNIDIVKSIVGFIWINAIDDIRNDLMDYAQKYTYNLIKKSENKGIRNYRELLQIVLQEYGWEYSEQTVLAEYKNDNTTIFVTTIAVKTNSWEKEATAAGDSKVNSRNNAAKEMLNKIVQYCDNSRIKAKVLKYIDPEIQFYFNDEETLSKREIVQNSIKTNAANGIMFCTKENVLYICKGTISCRKKMHSISSATGILETLPSKKAKININYCKECNKYFINRTEYKFYQNIYGVLLGNFRFEDESVLGNGGYENWDKESILHLCGYTVSQAAGLSSEDRKVILKNLIDKEIISKYRIMDYLQFFLNRSKYQYNLRIASQKWLDDLNWVREYKIDEQDSTVISQIVK